MAVHSKTRQRVRIILILAVVGALCLAGAYLLRKRQVEARILRDRDAGYTALEQGEYFTALHKIGPFLQRHPSDPKALLAYAQARRRVEEPNNKHLVDAIALYRRLLEIDPENASGREELLEIFRIGALNTEILTLTENRSDSASLRARAFAQANRGETQDSVDLARRYLKEKSSDLRMHMFLCTQMLRAQSQPSSSATLPAAADTRAVAQYVDQVIAQHPSEPQFQLLKAFSCIIADQPDQALEAIRLATAEPLKDIEHVGIAVDLLDSMEHYDESLAVLEKAAAGSDNVEFQRLTIARLYQARKFDEVVKRLAHLDQRIIKADTDLLAHRAMALRELNKATEAQRDIELLSGRKGDFAAMGWASVLTSLPKADEIADDRRIIEACRDGLRGEADNPYFRLHLGDAYSRLGENDAAAGEWLKSARAANTWSKPLARLFRMALSTRPDRQTIRELADRSERLASGDPELLAMVASARARLGSRDDAATVAAALAVIDQVQQSQPGEPDTLDLKVRLLAETGSRDKAKKLVEQSLAAEPPLRRESYLALARASESARLGMEELCFNRCLAVHKASYPVVAAQAFWLARNGRADDAVKYLESSRENAADRESMNWRRAYGQLLDFAQDERAGKYWLELADSQPDLAVLQRDVLVARSTQTNRELIRRAIDRLQAVMRDEGVNWRLAEARWILQGAALSASETDRERDVVKATALLGDLARKYPDHLDTRLLLSDCLLQLEKKEPAIDNLVAAAKLLPTSIPINLRLASLLQSTGDYGRAAPYLERARALIEAGAATAVSTAAQDQPPATQPDEASEEAYRRTLAALYAARGDIRSARSLLERPSSTAGADQDLGLAELLARRGELDDASAAKLMESPTLSRIEIVAEQYARVGRPADAEAALARLVDVEATPGQRELVRGLYLQRRNDLEAAAAQLRAACQAIATDAKAWRALITCMIQLGRGDDALSAAADASRAMPDEQVFARFLQQKDVVAVTIPNPVLRPLTTALMDGTSDPEITISALSVARDGFVKGETVAQVASQLRPLADRAPALAQLQYLLVDLYLSIRDFDNAVVVASRVAQFLPADPNAARKSAEALAAAGRWNEAIGAATQWRGRLGAATRPADELLARAYLSTGNFDAALAQLQPYLQRAQADPLEWNTALALYAQGLLGKRRGPEAESLLRPTLSLGAQPRGFWISIALSIRESDITAAWLKEVAAVMPADAISERLTLARAWAELLSRDPQPAFGENLDAQISQITTVMDASSSATAEEWMVLGVLKEMRKDTSGAESAYHAALKRDANFALAKNNLAMLILRRDGDVAEALRLATEAAADLNNPARSECLDTLAQIQLKAGQYAAAEASIREAMKLQPREPRMEANLVEILLASGKTDEAQRQFQELERLVASGSRSELAPRIEELRGEIKKAGTRQN